MVKHQSSALVTGGAGFIGSNLTEALLERDLKVTVIDDLSSGIRSNLDNVSNGIEFHEQSITDDICGLLEGVETVFHLAANVFITRSIEDPLFDATTNILGTLNLLEECRRANVQRVVFASSSAVYGDPVRTPIAENHPLAPKSPYAASKLSGEQYMGVYHRLYGMETVCLRFFNVYGPRQRADSPYSGVVARFCDRARRGEPLVLYGDGSQTRDFVHVSDVVQALIAASTSEKAKGNAYNIGRGEPTSVLDLAKVAIETTRSKSGIVFTEPRPGDVSHSLADISAAREDFGYSPTVSLREGIEGLMKKDY